MTITKTQKDTEIAKPLPVREPIAPPVGDKPVLGLDVSRYQPKVNWLWAYKSGFRFAICKATDGVAGRDAMFLDHRKEAHDAGLIVGAYHFYRFLADPINQAEHFYKTTGGVFPGELPMCLDVEWDRYSNGKYTEGKTMDQEASDNVLKCLERIEKLSGITPLIYTNAYFFTGFTGMERFSRFIPWIPAYKTTGDKVKVPKCWPTWEFWQFTDKHKDAVAIVGEPNLDGDYFNGSLEELKAMTRNA